MWLIIFGVGAIMVMAGCLWLYSINKTEKRLKKSARMKRFEGGDYMIELEDGSKYVGDCTCWKEFPSGKRVGTLDTDFFVEIWEREKWRMKGLI